MATFHSLPTELLHQVSSYLAPFDQVALSATSKNFHTTTKPRIRLDQISQHIYLSLNLTTANLSAPIFLINHPYQVQTLLKNTYYGIFPAQKCNAWDRYIAPPRSLSVQCELLQSYFPGKGFPQCTIAHHYVSAINKFAELVHEFDLSNDLGEVLGWAHVKMDSQRFLERLEQTPAKMMKATKGFALQ